MPSLSCIAPFEHAITLGGQLFLNVKINALSDLFNLTSVAHCGHIAFTIQPFITKLDKSTGQGNGNQRADDAIVKIPNRNVVEGIFYSVTEVIFELSGEIACSSVTGIGETICLTKAQSVSKLCR